MTKNEAVREFVSKRFDPIRTECVRIIAEHCQEYPQLPMWGTMWQVDSYMGEKLMNKSRKVRPSLPCYESEEMAGEYNVYDIHHLPTAVYIYEIDGQYLIGIHGAGWNYFEGVWDMLYDLCGMVWHEEALEPVACAS